MQGTLENKKVIAVKKLQRKEKVEVEQFMNEVSILSGLKHKNLVKLEGFCIRGQNQGQQEGLLCYEFLPDGNLEDRLYGRRGAAKLTWKERSHILKGICSGLQYLHNESPNNISIIHMDLKTDNILLQVQEDKKNGGVVITPKISDFGISRNHDSDKQHEYVDKVVGNRSVTNRNFFMNRFCCSSELLAFAIRTNNPINIVIKDATLDSGSGPWAGSDSSIWR